MKKKEWNEALNHLDSDLIEKHIEQKEKLRQKKRKTKAVWLRLGAIAASVLLIISAVIVVPMLREDELPEVPIWDTAQYSADEIADLFAVYDGAETNAYTKVYAPNSKYLYINDLMNDDYLNIYQYANANKELSEAELKSFVKSILTNLTKSLGISMPEYYIKEADIITEKYLDVYLETDPYFMIFRQTARENRLMLTKLEGDHKIVLDGETIQIDQRLSDEEILESVQSIKNKLFDIFDVSFSDVKIVRSFDAYSKHGAACVEIYFYDEDAHYLNAFSDRPISDHLCVSFDNRNNYSNDIVSDGVLQVSTVDYYNKRFDVKKAYTNVAKAKKISLSEAEALLYNGYVFGGHSCPICMREQDKVSFEGYDFVGMEYVFGYDDTNGKSTEVIPFYVFYKNIGKVGNGNTVYAKTYVPAVQVSGYEEYFESQTENHKNSYYDSEVQS